MSWCGQDSRTHHRVVVEVRGVLVVTPELAANLAHEILGAVQQATEAE